MESFIDAPITILVDAIATVVWLRPLNGTGILNSSINTSGFSGGGAGPLAASGWRGYKALINPAVTIGVDPVTGIVISERLTGNAIQTHGSIFAEALP